MEKSLKPDDYIHPSAWPECKTTYLVDVMACIRRVTAKIHKTFGDFIGKGFFDMVLRLCIGASRIDFVFDTYVDGSVKDSERSRRCTTQAIEILNLNEETLLPIDMNTFWPSSSNKTKLQLMAREWIIKNAPHKCPQIQVILSGIGVTDLDRTPCKSVTSPGQVRILADIQYSIEETDVRLIPHALHAAQEMTKRIVILSNDTDVIVLGTHYFTMLHRQGLG